MKSSINALENESFPELAAALVSQNDAISRTWEDAVHRLLPSAHKLTFEQVRDDLPEVLDCMADALRSDRARESRALFEATLAHGRVRFHQDFDLRELLVEYRILRPIVVEQIEISLGRRINDDEGAALHVAIDVTLQQSVMNFVAYQQDQLRTAAHAERRFLAFLSHDLRNNLNSLVLTLELLKKRLRPLTDFAEDVDMMEAAQEGISTTVSGMERLLQAERLRNQPPMPRRDPLDIAAVVGDVMREFKRLADRKGVTLSAVIAPGVVVGSDRELLMLVLQNLISNAIKYSDRGTVTVRCACPDASSAHRCVISVSDQGRGIAPEHIERIFEAFRRGDTHGQDGVGLGLAIATQAARLLKGELTVESKPGHGATFHLSLPPGKSGA